ncbi:hypothetical protein DI09_81p20 [Mitosporidium daphniae]|uniref:HRDC domain-containing protein n=1 Tax=Mitosporidium daphniae TaxID=1485682 RepID=A0A098VN13_9MICR|nr:uncharacterized protein DI09_81p20 [Mitosporidium daphniae]KGG50199.1 hypothetical protein DI09_81p20 [Mitosporidium daphniae]|eukprot:XP_013236635.1 uncharacterized protein DI09_81p20 [Mitosporidium daphniae]
MDPTRLAPSCVHISSPIAPASSTRLKINGYIDNLNSIISCISALDLELLLLTNDKMAILISELTSSLWNNAAFLHDLLMRFFNVNENRPVSFLHKKTVETLSLSLEGLSPIDDPKESKIPVLELYSTLLEKIDFLLDSSLIYKENFLSSCRSPKETAQIIQLGDGGIALGASFDQAVPRSQLTFYDAPCDNSREAKFSPRLESIQLGAPFSKQIESLLSAGEPLAKLVSVAHNFISIASDSLKNPSYERMEKRPLMIIDTASQLENLVKILDQNSVFAIDVEYHSLRSFRGFSCLIQISTPDEDIIIDALALREHLFLLNTPFGDPSKLKIFHGCRQDLLWLQKDFSIFVAGIFDTFVATTAVLSLSLPSFSLASLVSTFCSTEDSKLEMDKELQLADWRIRPLSQQMLRYARADTYFLLSLFVNFIATTASDPTAIKGWIEWSIRESSSLALIRYSPEEKKSSFESDRQEALVSAQKSLNIPLSAPSIRAFNALWAWRDTMARAEDESPRYVLPNFMLIKIAQRVPSDSQSVLSCCNPVPPLVRQHSSDIAFLIWKAASSIETIIPVSQPTLVSELVNEGNGIYSVFPTEYQVLISENLDQLRKETDVPSSLMANILSPCNSVSANEEIVSKITKIKETFSLAPWELIEDENNQENGPQKSDIDNMLVSVNMDLANSLEDLSEDITLKKKKRKKSKKPDTLEFISSAVEPQTDANSLPFIENNELTPIPTSLASKSFSFQNGECLKRKSRQSDAIEAPIGYVSQRKNRKQVKGVSQSFLN